MGVRPDAHSRFLYEDLDKEAFKNETLNAPSTYAEDRAFINRLKTRDVNRLSHNEICKLINVAKEGLKVREEIDRQLGDLAREKATRIADGTFGHGLKYEEIIRREMEWLKGV